MIGLVPVYNILLKLLSRAYVEHSVPAEVEHSLVWTKMPIYHPDLLADSIKSRIDQDGLWGFTGCDPPPPSPSNLSTCISKLAEWDVTMDKMIKSETPTEEEIILIQKAGREVHRYVKNTWVEKEWETAWFVNPPVSVYSLIFRKNLDYRNFLRDFKVCLVLLMYMCLLDANNALGILKYKMLLEYSRAVRAYYNNTITCMVLCFL